MTKCNTIFSALLMFHEKRSKKPNKYFKVLIYVIYIIIDNYICIDCLAYKSKQLSEISVDSKYADKYFNGILGIGIKYLFSNLLALASLSPWHESFCMHNYYPFLS